MMFQNSKVICITLTQRLGSKQSIMRNFNEFIQTLRRLNINIHSYFWSKEFTKKGERHLHIICNFIEKFHNMMFTGEAQRYLSSLWKIQTKGESFRVWINESEIKNAAGYAMKYLSKAFSDEVRFKKHEHRYGFSRNAPPFKPDNFKTIEYDSFTLEYHPGDYQRIGKNEKPKQK